VTVDRNTVRVYLAASWAEVIRHARTELARNSPAATPDEAKYLGLPVLMEWVDEDGSEGGIEGVLIAIEPDGDRRWAVTDDGFGADMNTAGFTLRTIPADR
jgi:hypothetical protein